MPLRCILTCTPLVVSIFDLRAGTLLVFSLGNDTPLIVCFFGLALGFFRFFSFATILQNSVRTLGGKTTEALFFKNLLPLLLQWFVFWLYNFETLFGIILQRSPLSHHTTLLKSLAEFTDLEGRKNSRDRPVKELFLNVTTDCLFHILPRLTASSA